MARRRARRRAAGATATAQFVLTLSNGPRRLSGTFMVLDRRENASRRQSACTERMWPACSLASLDRSGLQVPPPAHGHCTFPAHHIRSRWMDWSVWQTLRPSRHGEFARSRFHRGRRRALLEYCPATLALCLRPCGLVPSRRGGHGQHALATCTPPKATGGMWVCISARTSALTKPFGPLTHHSAKRASRGASWVASRTTSTARQCGRRQPSMG